MLMGYVGGNNEFSSWLRENNTLEVDGKTYYLYEENGVIYYSSSDKKPTTETPVPVVVPDGVTEKEYQEDEKHIEIDPVTGTGLVAGAGLYVIIKYWLDKYIPLF